MAIADLFGNQRVPDSPPGMKAFNPYAAGNKSYGSGRPMPTIGPVASPQGYAERDNRAMARRNAIMRRMKASDKGDPMSSAVIGYATKGVFD